MPANKLILSILLAAMCSSAAALERRYLASLEESHWTLTDDSRTLCRLEHSIPRFGKAAFVRESGRAMRLEISTQHRFVRGINVELRSEATGWNGLEMRAVLARFETSGRRPLFRIPSDVVEQIYYELRSGHQPGFLFYTDYPLIASLSAVRFNEAERAFTRCIAGLYRHNFDDVRVSNILFGPDEEFASPEEEENAVRRILDYLSVDDAVSEIVITGHADRTGDACYNEGLSERRALHVYDLLVARGIDPAMLRVDYRGEQRPAKQGSKQAALAANRRVTVELRH